MFWLLFLEVLRILKPHGLFYLNAPTNGSFHRYPVDCWRFYPDSGIALAKWGQRQGMATQMLESFVSHQMVNPWNDFVAVFVRDHSFAPLYPMRMLSGRSDIENAHSSLQPGLLHHSAATEDLRRLAALRHQDAVT
jgi:hypothetical protein